MELKKALHTLGIEVLRPFQKEALNILLTGRNLLTLMPTSAGKSLIFTSFAMVQERLVVVIEPHLALEIDQVRQLQDKGVAAACLNSLQSSAERKSVLARIEQGKLLLLFVTPEMLQNRKVQTALQQADPAGIMIDEAHSVCKQGPGFREDYLRIREFVQSLSNPPVVGAFTATAPPSTEQYILEKLSIEDATVIRGSVTRDNIELHAIEVGHGLGSRKDADLIEQRKREIICKQLRKHKGERVIIYSNTIKHVEKLHHYLCKQGFDAEFYHGKCEGKPARLERFTSGQVKIMVATNAFGLGVNIPDIRLVIHHAPLIGLDDYTQEAGRAGRDGKKAIALLLWHEGDFTTNRRLIKENQMDLKGAELKERLDALDALHRYASEEHACRWGMIREFFGEKFGKRCKKRCDNCKKQINKTARLRYGRAVYFFLDFGHGRLTVLYFRSRSMTHSCFLLSLL